VIDPSNPKPFDGSQRLPCLKHPVAAGALARTIQFMRRSAAHVPLSANTGSHPAAPPMPTPTAAESSNPLISPPTSTTVLVPASDSGLRPNATAGKLFGFIAAGFVALSVLGVYLMTAGDPPSAEDHERADERDGQAQVEVEEPVIEFGRTAKAPPGQPIEMGAVDIDGEPSDEAIDTPPDPDAPAVPNRRPRARPKRAKRGAEAPKAAATPGAAANGPPTNQRSGGPASAEPEQRKDAADGPSAEGQPAAPVPKTTDAGRAPVEAQQVAPTSAGNRPASAIPSAGTARAETPPTATAPSQTAPG
jgi:hypothetical protein